MQTTPPKYIGFAAVARRYGVDPYTVWRWRVSGRGPQQIKLRAIKCGGRWKTRWRWVREFFDALAGDQPPAVAPTRRRSHEAVMKELAAMGVKPVRLT